MRLRVGSTLRIFNSKQGEFEGKIIDIQKDCLEMVLTEFIALPQHEPELTLYFAPIKNPNMSFLVQKATELGVTKIQPIITQHTVVTKANSERLELVAIEATEQCKRFFIPQIFPIKPLGYILQNPIHTGSLIFSNENETSQTLPQYLDENKPSEVGIIIGPEGGFSHAEIEMIKDYQGISVSLGKRIMRAETAMIATLSVYQAIAGDWNLSQ